MCLARTVTISSVYKLNNGLHERAARGRCSSVLGGRAAEIQPAIEMQLDGGEYQGHRPRCET